MRWLVYFLIFLVNTRCNIGFFGLFLFDLAVFCVKVDGTRCFVCHELFGRYSAVLTGLFVTLSYGNDIVIALTCLEQKLLCQTAGKHQDYLTSVRM